MKNPVLIEVTRGSLVESVHTGSIVLARPDGQHVLGLGDTTRTVFPRSAVKALQALPLIESGAAERFGLGEDAIALACASHTGTARHAALAAAMLARLGLKEDALGCGAHAPLGTSAARELWRSGSTPSQLHNNCSGKHAGMLAVAMHRGWPIEGYWLPDHPVQRLVHQIMRELTGLPLGQDVMGIDGCSVPNWAMPLGTLAQVFAKLVSGEVLPPGRAAAMRRIMDACWAEPELVAGRGRADSVVMAALPRRVFMKTGAEGVYCGGFPEFGLGFALKIDDGATRASAGAVMALIERVLPQARGLMHRNEIRSWRGLPAGAIRTAASLDAALDGLRL
ncbi:MAG: asparaginase [Hyphomicrobiaceae bacterium]|nr:asparaginase [Hyphomicrobiaceae bacterium]